MKGVFGAVLLLLGVAISAPAHALVLDGGVCPRANAGTEIARPPDLYSKNGVLNVALDYHTSLDNAGRTLFCFVTKEGQESPTLHVYPGDTIQITLTNMVPNASGAPSETVSTKSQTCGDSVMTVTSVNMHFHGTNLSPKCHSDETIRTMVNSGQTFSYSLHIPRDEPPGLYWYHPHIHGISSPAVQGGATGAIEVEGIANIQPAVAGLPERYIVLRDQQEVAPAASTSSIVPNWDVSVNYVPVSYPKYVPAVIKMQRGSREFWRVVNASANTIMHLQVTYDGVAQPLQIVALDGVPTGSKDGTRKGTTITQNDILLPLAGRVEFILAAPASPSVLAMLKTLAIDGGPSGDTNPARPLVKIVTSTTPIRLPRIAPSTGYDHKLRFDDLATAGVTAKRRLYFSEYTLTHISGGSAPTRPETKPSRFFITVAGQTETLFDANNPPAITTTQGAVEEWTIQNRTDEVHEFHIHQIHFLVEEVNGVKIPKAQQQLYDTFQVPYWSGTGRYPSIKVKMDFRGPTVGDFVYHCHILDHEDLGMMATIRVRRPKI